MMGAFGNFRYGVRSMAPVRVWLRLKCNPPVESFVELKNSGLVDHINTDRGRQSLLHSDGAQAWPRLVSDMGKPFWNQ